MCDYTLSSSHLHYGWGLRLSSSVHRKEKQYLGVYLSGLHITWLNLGLNWTWMSLFPETTRLFIYSFNCALIHLFLPSFILGVEPKASNMMFKPSINLAYVPSCLLIFFLILRQSPSKWPGLPLNSLCHPGSPWICDPPVSGSWNFRPWLPLLWMNLQWDTFHKKEQSYHLKDDLVLLIR